MIKKLFSIKYQDSLVLDMLKGATVGAIPSNIIAPLIIGVSLYNFFHFYFIIVWLSIHLFVFSARIYTGNQLIDAIQNKQHLKAKYFKRYMFIIAFTSLLYGILSWVTVLHADIPDSIIFLIGTVILALTAGSISTLGTILIAFIAFVVLSIVPFIIAMLLHGGILFYTIAIVYTIYLFIHLLSGYRVFASHRNSLELKEKFKTIFNKSADGIAIIKDGKFSECNETVIKMFGYEKSVEEFLALPLVNLMPPKQEDGISSIKKMFIMLKKSSKEIITFEWQHTKQNGEIFWVEITLSPIHIENTQVIHGIWRNIDERKKAQQEIYELNTTLETRVQEELVKNREKDKHLLQQSRFAQMGEMISMIAHQWRQPLSAISSTSIALELKAHLNQTNKDIIIEHTQKIAQYSQHLSTTINDFRDFFKPTKEKNKTSYSKIIDSVLNIIRITIENKNIEIIEELNSTSSFISYSNEIKQVVLNLFKNAEDALLEKKIENPYIKVFTFEKENKFIIEISDNAGGVPSDIIENIFNPYFSTKLNKNGTGLGLYMSRIIIEEHCKGSLSVRNDKNGAVFRIEL